MSDLPPPDELPPAPVRMSHPDCTEDASVCRISFTATTTQIAWAPEYDGNGANVAVDPNTQTITYTCSACSRTWSVEQKAGTPPVMKNL